MMKIATPNKHEFALFYPNLSAVLTGKHQDITIADESLVHRIVHVLRLMPQESLTLFDRTRHAFCTIKAITKKSCIVTIENEQPNSLIVPPITFLLPLLKRDTLEELVYSLTELGVTSIQLVKTEKVQRSWAGKSEYERLQKIIIAAAEQSKNYAYPELHEPCSLESALKNSTDVSTKLYADAHGISLSKLVEKISTANQTSFALMIGPEGDLLDTEKERLLAANFIFCALTPTILRSVQAGAIFSGIIRSFYR